MRRDKFGRFVKKASGGTVLDGSVINYDGTKYIFKTGASTAYDTWKNGLEAGVANGVTDWLAATNPDNNALNLNSYADAVKEGQIGFAINDQNEFFTIDANGQRQILDQNDILPLINAENSNYYYDHTLDGAINFEEYAAGLKSNKWVVDKDKDKSQKNPFVVDKNKIANFLELARAGISAATNNNITKKALEAEIPYLQTAYEKPVNSIYGNYRELVAGEKAAAQLRNQFSTPITSDGALWQDARLKSEIAGNTYIDEGRRQDEALRMQTKNLAYETNAANAQSRLETANENRRAQLMSFKNKKNIEAMNKSVNFSKVVDPLITATEQRIRNEGKQQEQYQDYYNEKLVSSQVWNTFRDGLTDSQKALVDIYLTQGQSAINTETADATKKADWLAVKRIMNNEIIRRTAALKGVTVNLPSSSSSDNYGLSWETPSVGFNKKGGTIYKAKLTKRTKDNDRAAKSIETSKKIAARFLEKAIDSLYTYNDVELIAKPKNKKRKYQAGGGLPFVGFTPVFATSETGVPQTQTTEKEEGLTTKAILELLKDVDGLPSDIDAIHAALSSFLVDDVNDPLGLDSSNIASYYMSILSNIKKAKANREWYDKAYDQLREKGALNELAVDSRGSFIGMNSEGDFERFTAEQIANQELNGYHILTNSELLDIRARYPNAAFNSNLIMEAANGISIQQVTEYINKTIQGLGSDKETTQVFGNQSKEVLAGLQQLQQAAQEVGQDLSISELYEANIFTEQQVRQANYALSYLYQTLPTNMKALLFARTGSEHEALKLIKTMVESKLSYSQKLEFSPKNTKTGKTSSGKKTGSVTIDGLELSPAQMLQQGFGERESVLIQNNSTTGLQVEAITMPVTTGSNGEPVGATTLEGVARSQYGGLLNFTNASMGGNIIPFEGRRNIAVDGSKIYSMYLPIDQNEYYTKGNIIPDIALIDKVHKINQIIKEKQITDPTQINQMYEEAGLPAYMNEDGTINPTSYRRFGVLNGTALDNAFGQSFIESSYLKKIDDDDIINGAISIMNIGRDKSDRVEYDSKSFFNFGGLLGDYDTVYQGTIFIPMSNDVFLGIAGSGNNIESDEANELEAQQQQKQRVSTYKNPGQLQ